MTVLAMATLLADAEPTIRLQASEQFLDFGGRVARIVPGITLNGGRERVEISSWYPVLVHRLAVSLDAYSPHSVALMQLRFASFVVVNVRRDFHPHS